MYQPSKTKHRNIIELVLSMTPWQSRPPRASAMLWVSILMRDLTQPPHGRHQQHQLHDCCTRPLVPLILCYASLCWDTRCLLHHWNSSWSVKPAVIATMTSRRSHVLAHARQWWCFHVLDHMLWAPRWPGSSHGSSSISSSWPAEQMGKAAATPRRSHVLADVGGAPHDDQVKVLQGKAAQSMSRVLQGFTIAWDTA